MNADSKYFNRNVIHLEEIDKYVGTLLENLKDIRDDDEDTLCDNFEQQFIPFFGEDKTVKAVYHVLKCLDCGEAYVVNIFTSDAAMEAVAEELGFRE